MNETSKIGTHDRRLHANRSSKSKPIKTLVSTACQLTLYEDEIGWQIILVKIVATSKKNERPVDLLWARWQTTTLFLNRVHVQCAQSHNGKQKEHCLMFNELINQSLIYIEAFEWILEKCNIVAWIISDFNLITSESQTSLHFLIAAHPSEGKKRCILQRSCDRAQKLRQQMRVHGYSSERRKAFYPNGERTLQLCHVNRRNV